MAKPPAHRPVPRPHPKRPLGRAILRFQGRALLWALVWIGWLCARSVDGAIWFALYPRRNPRATLRLGWAILRLAWGGVWRLATAISVGYLVFDRIYETSVTVTAPVPDARRPFEFPFSITNNSHLWSIRNVAWS